MEKLQAALEKARNRRKDDVQAKSPRPAAARLHRGDQSATLWANLKEIELSGPTLNSHHIVSQQASAKTTPFDILRTKTLLQMRQNGWKSIAITSPMPQSGKTTTACNLALGLGRQDEFRTMLFDLDLQNPSVSDFLGYTPEADISDMLAGDIAFADQAVRVGSNVAISMAKRTASDPTQVLLSTKTVQTMDSIRSAYNPDIMIFDTPSILSDDNARAFLRNVDCAMIVLRADATRYSHFDACEREVAEYTNVIGVVLNAFRIKKLENSIE